MKYNSSGFIGIVLILIIALALAGGGVYYVSKEAKIPESTSEAGTDITIEDTKSIALGINAAIKAKVTGLSRECIAAEYVSREAEYIYVNLKEVHNTECGGDLTTSPRITTLKINTSNGTVYNQSFAGTFVRLHVASTTDSDF